MNVAEQQRMLLEICSLKRLQKMGITIQNMKGQVCDRAAMKYKWFERIGRKCITLGFYYCPDKYVSLVFLLALGRGKCVFMLLYITRPRDITSPIAIIHGCDRPACTM